MAATIYRPPEEVGPPPDLGDFLKVDSGVEKYFAALRKWEEKVSDWCRRTTTTPNDLVGHVWRYGVADGKASYAVWKTRPLTLIELDEEYRIDEITRRGITVTDIRRSKEFEDRWAAERQRVEK